MADVILYPGNENNLVTIQHPLHTVKIWAGKLACRTDSDSVQGAENRYNKLSIIRKTLNWP